MLNNIRSKSGSLLSLCFGIIILSAGIVWTGKSMGIIPDEFDLFKYVCPAGLVIFGFWIIAEAFIKKNQKES
jgi:hypothetical protein